MAALHPPLVSHPPFNFAPGCTNGPKDWVQKNGLNISSSKRHSPFIYVYPLKSANKSSLPPGSGCKKGWVRKKIFEVGPKKEECEKGGGCEKKFSGAPHVHLCKILCTPLPAVHVHVRYSNVVFVYFSIEIMWELIGMDFLNFVSKIIKLWIFKLGCEKISAFLFS